MPQLNTSRVIVGGLAAGLVMNIINAVTNVFLLGAKWNAETTALNPGLTAKVASGTWGWVIVDFILGIITIWVYAGIRPRFGAGPRTALTAALIIWLAMHAAYASYAFLGYYSWSVVGASSLGGLIAALAGGYVGARLYPEAA